MRLAGCLLVEGCVAAAVVILGGLVGAGAVHEVRVVLAARHASPAVARAGGPLLAREDLSGESGQIGQTGPLGAEGGGGADSSGTFLGMADDLLLTRLKNQPVARLKLNRGGSSLSFRIDFADGSRAAWKPAQTNLQTIPRKEVAAYRLNRLLSLNAVPPAVSRAISRDDLFGLLHPESAPALPRIRAETIIGPNG
ncbi:MAG: hypothetical protein H7X95_14150, partial [Deltaproteobacteria bacterium]|nr:hypothetical protein [Deltaproteobacteria bacterium]